MTNPYWPPPKTRAPRHHRQVMLLYGMSQLVGLFSGLALTGFEPEGPVHGAMLVAGMLIAGGIWWCVCVRWWRARCPVCHAAILSVPQWKLWSRGLPVSLTYDCIECRFSYSSEDADRDFGFFLAWLVLTTQCIAGAIFAIVGIGMACLIAIPQGEWLMLVFFLAFSAIGVGWVAVMTFVMRWFKRHCEETSQDSRQDSSIGASDGEHQ